MQDKTATAMHERTATRGWVGPIALGCGVAGAVGAFVLYWLVVPSVLLGGLAIVLGRRARREGRADMGTVAMTLGVVALLLVPAFLSTADTAEEWGRDCALHPESDPNC